MRTLWLKAFRDARAERARAALAIAAIAVGIAGFFAVLSTYAILRRELNIGYLATNPASAILLTDAIDPALLARVIARPDVDDAEGRLLLRGRIRPAGGKWQRLGLFVVADLDHPRISTVTREQGSQPLTAGDVLIERDAFQVARARVGDQVELELQTDAPGKTTTLHVAGGVHDAGQAQARMENMVYAYITPATLPLLGVPSALNRLYLLAAGNRMDEARVRRVAGDVKTWLEGEGHVVTRVIVPTPGQHPHATIMGLLLLAISGLGLVILGISSVIVFAVMLSVMARQRRQIGVMKAVGGTREQIAAIYLAQAGLLGLAAIAIGVVAGLAGNRALTNYLARLLNFDVTSYAIPLWVYLLVALVGVAAPLLAAAYPVARSTEMTVREALAETAPTAPALRLRRDVPGGGRSAIGARIAGHASLRALTLGIGNTFRRPARSAITLATMSMAGAAFIAALNVRTSVMARLDEMFGSGTFGSIDRYAFDQHMLMIYVFLLIAAAILTLVGSLGMMTVTSLNVLDRRRELAVLRTIGATPGAVAGLIVSEATFVAAVSWVLANLAAWPLSWLLGRFLSAILFRGGLAVAYSMPGVIAWFAIATTVGVASSIIPAWLAARRSIREAISYE